MIRKDEVALTIDKEGEQRDRIKLDDSIVARLVRLWQISGNEETLTDVEICTIVGITRRQLTYAMEKGKEFTVEINREVITSDLTDIRARAKASTKTSYLQSIRSCIEEAKENGDFNTAAKWAAWLLEKQYPALFGNRQDIHLTTKESRTISEDEFKKSIDKIRQLKEVYANG
jgi:hypothetical protein